MPANLWRSFVPAVTSSLFRPSCGVDLSGLPVFIAYIFFPAWTYTLRTLGLPEYRNVIDAAWLCLMLLCLAKLLTKPRLRTPLLGALPVCAALLCFCALAVLRFGPALLSDSFSPAPLLMEIKPLLYAACALLAAAAFGLPKKRHFIQGGVVLALFILTEAVIDAAQYDRLVRPMGSGEVNYDAFLLLLSFIIALSAARDRRVAAFVLFLGIAACLSRTAVVATAFVIVLLPGVPIAVRLGTTACCAGLFFAYFSLRGIDSQGLEGIDRWWMWTSGARLLWEHPLQAMFGFPAGEALPVRPPAFLAALWEAQGKAWDARGIHPFNYHAFWLRIVITWGMVATAALCLPAAFVLLKRRTPLLLGIAAAGAIMGTTMGLIYPGNTGVAFFLACMSAMHHGEGT